MLPEPMETKTSEAVLGCAIGLAIVLFFVWVFFIREPDPEWQQRVAEHAQKEEVRKNNARIACNSGVQSACVEYGKMVD